LNLKTLLILSLIEQELGSFLIITVKNLSAVSELVEYAKRY